MARAVCRVLGILLILLGIAGLVSPRLTGLHSTPLWSAAHLAAGLLASSFGFAGRVDTARLGGVLLGVAFLIAGAAGIMATRMASSAPGAADRTANNVLHVALGMLFLGGASAGAPEAPGGP